MRKLLFRPHARALLDASFLKKPWWFWLLSPLLFFTAGCVALAAHLRRKQGYAPFQPTNTTQGSRKSVWVVCVGNILVGGSGKSPVVQALARQAFEHYNVVGISVRGVGKPQSTTRWRTLKGPNILTVSSLTDPQLSALGDEGLEHLWCLATSAPPSKKYLILQGAQRKEALTSFQNLLNPTERGCLILDDGLQHFACPRHVNVCVWNPDLVATSPPFPFPLGPYREGWGIQSLRAFFQSAARGTAECLHLWSRSTSGQEASFQRSVEGACERLNISPQSAQIVTGRLEFFYVTDDVVTEERALKTNLVQRLTPIPLQKIQENLERTSSDVGVVCGIGRPQVFLSNLQDLFPNQKFHLCAVEDHGSLTTEARQFLKSFPVVMVTFKDFARWSTTGQALHHKVYVCQIKVDRIPLDPFAGDPSE